MNPYRTLASAAPLLLALGCSSPSASDAGGAGNGGAAPGAGGALGAGGSHAGGSAGTLVAAGGKAGTSSGAGGVVGAGHGGAAAGGSAAGHTGGGGMSSRGGGGFGGQVTSSGAGGGGAGGAFHGAGAAGSAGAGGKSGGAGAGTAGAGGGGAVTGSPPGDIAAAAGTPLVAAHSVMRALYAAYAGKLFQARRASDGKTQDISAVSAGGLVDLDALNTFCSGTTCTVARLYDQSGNGNDLWQDTTNNQPTVGFWTAANSTKYPIVVSQGYQWLRNRTMTKKIPTGSNPQTEYFVVHGDYAGRASGTNGCCYDYGNMENHIGDDGPGTMSALYFGDATDWTRGAGSGPWVMLDMENGVFAGGGSIAILNAGQASVNSSDPSLKYASPNIVVGLAKTDGTKNFEIKYGNASSGALMIAWNGSLPTNTNPTSYIPLHQQGGISLGEGGDGSAMGTGAFSEGAIIAAETTDATDDAIQANLITLYR